MALSDTLTHKLYQHLREQDTLQQKVEFHQLLHENEELAQVYYILRNAGVSHSYETYKKQLSAILETAITETDPATDPLTNEEEPVVSQPWYSQLYAKWSGLMLQWLQPVPAPVVRLSFMLALVIGLGWSARKWFNSQRNEDLLVNYGNLYSPNQGNSSGLDCPISVGNNDYYTFHPDDRSALAQRIQVLQARKDLNKDCQSYLLGRTYLGLNQYKEAITAFQLARKLAKGRLQQMATYDLALSYILAGESSQGIALLNSRLDWSEPKVIDALKQEVDQ